MRTALSSRLLGSGFASRVGFFVGACVLAGGSSALADTLNWHRLGDFPVQGAQYNPIACGDKIYLAGGSDMASARFTDVRYAAAQAGGGLGAWTSTTSLSHSDQGPDLAVVSGRMYLAGASSANGFQSAPILPDGSLGAWRAEEEPADGWVWGSHQELNSYNGHLYQFGGWWPYSSDMNEKVYLAAIGADGLIAGWTQTQPMPEGRQHVSVHFFNNRAYIAGGITDGLGILDSVYSAPVNADGTLGSWRAEASLPHPLWENSSVVVGNSIYLFGGDTTYSGDDAGTLNTTVYRGTINPATGGIARWDDVGQMPSSFVQDPGAVYSPANGMVYLIGGWDGSSATAEVWAAAVPMPAAVWAGLALLGGLGVGRWARRR